MLPRPPLSTDVHHGAARPRRAPPLPDVGIELWQRLRVHVRCALFPQQPERVRWYVLVVHTLVRRRHLDPLHGYRRTVCTLLDSAHDETLPGLWRRVCADHVDAPLARLRPLLAARDTVALSAVEAAAHRVRMVLDCCLRGADDE